MNLHQIIKVNSDSYLTDVGLLILRVSFGLSIFLKHGLEKITGFGGMLPTFPDPIHIGQYPSLAIATLSDSFLTLVLIAGFATRPIAAFILLNIATAWIFVHHFEFFGSTADHGEMCVLYMVGLLALVFNGGGRFSLDALISRRSVTSLFS